MMHIEVPDARADVRRRSSAEPCSPKGARTVDLEPIVESESEEDKSRSVFSLKPLVITFQKA
jgi:hypothetical protein